MRQAGIGFQAAVHRAHLERGHEGHGDAVVIVREPQDGILVALELLPLLQGQAELPRGQGPDAPDILFLLPQIGEPDVHDLVVDGKGNPEHLPVLQARVVHLPGKVEERRHVIRAGAEGNVLRLLSLVPVLQDGVDEAGAAVVVVLVHRVVIPFPAVPQELPGLHALQGKPGVKALPDLEEDIEERGRPHGQVRMPHLFPVQGFLADGKVRHGDIRLHRMPVVGDRENQFFTGGEGHHAVRTGREALPLRSGGEGGCGENRGSEKEADQRLHQNCWLGSLSKL